MCQLIILFVNECSSAALLDWIMSSLSITLDLASILFTPNTWPSHHTITIAELVIYPAVDPLDSKSQIILDPTLYQASWLLPLLSRSIAELVIYPAVDPLDPQSRKLGPRLVLLLSCSIADEVAICPVVLPLGSKSRMLSPHICCRVRLLTSLSTPPTIILTLNNECSAPT
ncbi:hypothetical protein EDB89DRAFT_1907711 [Lactarius sanguifluus]|nr:hypothetical protein EDB89DRAFT_1907711 [Lactarius sanguifluus]